MLHFSDDNTSGLFHVEKETPIKCTVGNHCCVKDQPCSEEKHEPSASSFEIS